MTAGLLPSLFPKGHSAVYILSKLRRNVRCNSYNMMPHYSDAHSINSAAPSAPPSPPVVFGTTHESLSLNWQAPPFAETNGVILNYAVAVLEVETGRSFTVNSNTTQVTLEDLHPFYTYTCSIAAETVGIGPFSEHITIQLPEAGEAPILSTFHDCVKD